MNLMWSILLKSYTQSYMNVEILCVGKIKEKYLRDAIDEYTKRLSRYCKVTIREVADEKTIDKQSEALDHQVRRKEGERLLNLIKENAFVITLEIGGRMLDSVQMSALLDDVVLNSVSDIQFIIGGSLGLDEIVTKRSDYALSFSKMTFPHQLMRVILLEQIYRCFKISHHEPYHK